MNQRKRYARAAAMLALLGTGLSACREAQQHAAAPAPEYCRYTRIGPLCDSFDPAALAYTVALRLRPLSIVDAPDRALLIAHAGTLTPRPGTIRVLAPVGPVPEGRRAYPALPQPLPRHGNPRLVLLALTLPGAPGRIDVHSVVLLEMRVVASERVAHGLREASLRGAVASGWLSGGFSLTDRPGSVGDLYRLGSRQPALPAGAPVEQWATGLSWTKIGADTRERRLDWFRSIVNSGSCAGSGVAPPLLLAPRPQAWLDEYEATCPIRPPAAELRMRDGRPG